MTIPRQLAPTMGLAHGGVEFLEGFFLGFREVRKFSNEEKPAWKFNSSTGLCYGRKSQAGAVTRVLTDCFLSWRQKEFSSPTQKKIQRLMF